MGNFIFSKNIRGEMFVVLFALFVLPVYSSELRNTLRAMDSENSSLSSSIELIDHDSNSSSINFIPSSNSSSLPTSESRNHYVVTRYPESEYDEFSEMFHLIHSGLINGSVDITRLIPHILKYNQTFDAYFQNAVEEIKRTVNVTLNESNIDYYRNVTLAVNGIMDKVKDELLHTICTNTTSSSLMGVYDYVKANNKILEELNKDNQAKASLLDILAYLTKKVPISDRDDVVKGVDQMIRVHQTQDKSFTALAGDVLPNVVDFFGRRIPTSDTIASAVGNISSASPFTRSESTPSCNLNISNIKVDCNCKDRELGLPSVGSPSSSDGSFRTVDKCPSCPVYNTTNITCENIIPAKSEISEEDIQKFLIKDLNMQDFPNYKIGISNFFVEYINGSRVSATVDNQSLEFKALFKRLISIMVPDEVFQNIILVEPVKCHVRSPALRGKRAVPEVTTTTIAPSLDLSARPNISQSFVRNPAPTTKPKPTISPQKVPITIKPPATRPVTVNPPRSKPIITPSIDTMVEVKPTVVLGQPINLVKDITPVVIVEADIDGSNKTIYHNQRMYRTRSELIKALLTELPQRSYDEIFSQTFATHASPQLILQVLVQQVPINEKLARSADMMTFVYNYLDRYFGTLDQDQKLIDVQFKRIFGSTDRLFNMFYNKLVTTLSSSTVRDNVSKFLKSIHTNAPADNKRSGFLENLFAVYTIDNFNLIYLINAYKHVYNGYTDKGFMVNNGIPFDSILKYGSKSVYFSGYQIVKKN
uniref:Large tegument protein UL36 n=1 Tax=Atrato Virga-like virus 5 TaxID=2689344 RepID=A0A6B9KGF3_9VIRU|nr:large tegument protein UL36 [Atrato Virga-like virus 5]QHA33805.1 large tegument protein UL36 [Atrato Virga-like virus 5]